MSDMSSANERFILHWGEMGARWGLNRTVAQIHALLYLSPQPMTAEEIANALSVARSNVSTSLKTLQSWGLVNMVHVLGDRRDHFESLKDLWDMARVVVEGRKRRELDPTLTVLQNCLDEIGASDEQDEYVRARIQEMADFFEVMTPIYDQVRTMPKEKLQKLVKMAGRLEKLMGLMG